MQSNSDGREGDFIDCKVKKIDEKENKTNIIIMKRRKKNPKKQKLFF